jgi:hypothetical protein
MQLRKMCVDYVWNLYGASDASVLISTGRYKSWDDWKTQMSNATHYGDELCIEALEFCLGGPFHIISGSFLASLAVTTRVIGPESALPSLFLGCALDLHFYSFILK